MGGTGRWRLGGRIVVVAVAAMLAVQTVRSQFGMAALRGGNIALAHDLAPFDSDVRAQLAATLFTAGDVQGARTQAEAALRRSLINQSALRTLGFAQEKAGRTDEAARTMALASRLGWRDTQLSAWLLLHHALAGRFDEVLQQADALARRQKADNVTYPIFYAVLEDPRTRKLLVDRLVARPSWRGAFFNGASRIPARQFAGFEQLLRDLIPPGLTATREEVMPYINHLVADGQFAHARAVWLAWGHGGTDTGGATTVPYDPDFATVALNDRTDRALAPFEWSVTAESQDRVSVTGDRGLDIIPAVDGDGGVIVSQIVTLAPGRHALRFVLDGAGPTVIDWSLACRPDGALLQIPLSRTGNGIAGTFTIPETGCAGQILALRTRGQADPVHIRAVHIVPIG